MRASQCKAVLIESEIQAPEISMNDKLGSKGIEVVYRTQTLDGILERVCSINPDILILSVTTLSEKMLRSLTAINQLCPIPILVIAQNHAPDSFEPIVAAGISSYIVDDVAAERLPLIIELAIERFQQMRNLYLELDATKEKLSERKLIEQAKGILMQQKHLSEADAYAQMRTLAMNQGKTMKDLSTQILSVVELFE